MAENTDFAVGDRVTVLRYGHTQSSYIGEGGTVVGHDRQYVVVIMDSDEQNLTTLFLPNEIETVTPAPVATIGVSDDDSTGDYGIRLRDEYDTCFEYFHKPSGRVLLVTQFVSLDTLIRIAEDHKEGRR